MRLITKQMTTFTLSLLMGSLSGFAAEKTAKTEQANKTKEAMMQEMMAKGAPNEHHKKLEPLVGKWVYTVSWKMDANANPEISKGTTENKWILGGRYIQQEATGEAVEKQPLFQGIGLTGFDNIKKEYTSVWLDNMGTGMMTASGQFNKGTIAEKGTYACPVTNDKHRAFRANWKFIDNDHYTYEMFTKDTKGKEFKSVEIAYTRAK